MTYHNVEAWTILLFFLLRIKITFLLRSLFSINLKLIFHVCPDLLAYCQVVIVRGKYLPHP